ncbi:MAG: radical SAM protein [Oscillospiraceae bacterium]|nr:radical SAM protein [Oscillospiraceae bacterium]
MEWICRDCPRECGCLRAPSVSAGVCASPSLPCVARAAPHFGEEPCISGERGSGAVFFTGCSLGCVYCQNREISRVSGGRMLSVQALRELFLRLRDQGVHNINLVTPSHFARPIAQALEGLELGIPVVWNSSGYEKVETLKRLEGLVQIYMPDMKYGKSEPAARYSRAPDYPLRAAEAIREMFRQTGPYVLGDDGLLRSGVLIRHLILPEEDLNTMEVIDFVVDEFPEDSVLFSLMSQYTPMPGLERFPALQKTVDRELSERMLSYARRRGVRSGYWQEPEAAGTEQIPAFDGTGLA